MRYINPWFQGLAFWLVLMPGAALPQSAAATKEMDLATFLVAYRCGIVNRLDDLFRSTDPAMKTHRWLAITVEGGVQSYVQCIFDDESPQMLCEAASGFYGPEKGKERTLWLSFPAKASLASLGFDTSKEDGNYKQFIPSVRAENLTAVADLMLTALYLSYGARNTTPITLDWQHGPQIHLQPCLPVS